MDRAVPCAKRARENCDDITLDACEQYRADNAWAKALGIRSPFSTQDLRRWYVRRDYFCAWCHDHIGLTALPVSPAPHWFEDERAVEDPLRRTRMIDDWSVHLEYHERANPFRGENPFAAEVVIALDDDVWPELSCVCGDVARQ